MLLKALACVVNSLTSIYHCFLNDQAIIALVSNINLHPYTSVELVGDVALSLPCGSDTEPFVSGTVSLALDFDALAVDSLVAAFGYFCLPVPRLAVSANATNVTVGNVEVSDVRIAIEGGLAAARQGGASAPPLVLKVWVAGSVQVDGHRVTADFYLDVETRWGAVVEVQACLRNCLCLL